MNRIPARLLSRCLVVAVGLHALPAGAACEKAGPPHLESSYAAGWGIDHRNTRYQPRSSIDSANAGKLTLKWVYGLASSTPRSYPLITEDTIYVGDAGRGLIALDRATGCERWVHEHTGAISSAIVQGRIGERQHPALQRPY